MNWLKKILRKNSSTETPPAGQLEEGGNEPDPKMQRKLEEVCAAKVAAYAQIGEIDDDVLAPVVNPFFMGGPRWPSLRQSWRVIRKPSSTMVASDGLSDPFEDEKIPLGFRVEVCAEAPDVFENVASSWLFELVYQVSQLVAQHGRVYELLQKYKSLSTVVHVGGVPEQYRNEDGRVGVLLGFPARDLPSEIELPDGRIRLLVIKLLLPAEFKYIESGKELETMRNKLIEKFLSQPQAHLSTFSRASVV